MKPALDPLNLPLRDIHLPPAPSWWPPAPGWWLLGVALIVLPTLALIGWQRHRRGRLRRAALRELAALHEHTADPRRVAVEAEAIMRRVSLALDPAQRYVATTGEAWLARVHAIAPGFEDQALASELLRAPYAARSGIDAVALIAALERWIRALPTSARRLRELAGPEARADV